MPKATFNNLPDEKKNNIDQVAIDEFYKYGYEKASINRIVEKAGIAKGSFYQYFEGKEDLFSAIMNRANEKKREYFNILVEDSHNIDFFYLLRTLFVGSLKFQKDNPKLAAIADRFLKNANSKLKETIMGDGIEKSNLFLETLLHKNMVQKSVRSDLEISLTAHLITGLAISLSEYTRNIFDDIESLDEKIYQELVDETIRLIKEGIQLVT